MKGRDVLASIFIRTILIYLILIFIMRLSGKRQIGELQLSELVTTFLLSDIASIPLVDPSAPLLQAVIPIFTIISLEIVLSFLATKWNPIKKLVDDRPSVVIRNGVICKKEMSRVRLSADDLLCELRLKDIPSVEEVAYAILEPNGKISAFKKDDSPLSHVFVIDGAIQTNTLYGTGKNEAWVYDVLKKHGVRDIRQIFLLCATDGGHVTLIRQEDCQ